MFKKTSGFSLIELVIAMTIASMLSLLLFGFVRQMAKVGIRTAAAVDYGLALTVVHSQLERDLMAMVVPESAFASYKRAFKKEKEEKDKAAAVEKKTEEEPTPKEEKEEKRTREIPPPFLAKFRDNRLELLFFVTTNRMPRHKIFVPYNTRVVYQLLPETEPGLFKLVRAESSDIRRPIEDFTSGDVQSHLLISRIKSLTMKFFVPEEPKQEPKKESPEKAGEPAEAVEKKEEQPKKPEKIVYKELTAWDPAVLKKAPYMIPAYIEISGVRVDNDGRGDRSFTFAYKIPVFEWQHGRIKKIVEERTAVKKRVLKDKTAGSDGKKEEKKTLTVGGQGAAKQPSPRPPSGRAPAGSRPQPGRPQMRGR